MIGNQFGELRDQICGAVVSKKKKGDKVSIWTKYSKDANACMKIGYVLAQYSMNKVTFM